MGCRAAHVVRAILCVAMLAAWSPALAASIISPAEQACYNDARGLTPRATVRREARAILEQDPASFVAEYVLGTLEVTDGNYPDGLRHLRRARALADQQPAAETAEVAELTDWRTRVVLALADALDHADRLDEALRAWDEAAALSVLPGSIPDRTLQRINALLKLGRVTEAQGVADARLQEPGLTDAQKLALRVARARILFATEPDGARACEEFRALVQDAPAVEGFTPPLNDLAFHARRQGRYEEARTVLARSAAIQNPNSASHPFRTLADMDIASARWEEANASIRNTWNWLQTRKADIRFELLADSRLTAAQFYLAAGYPERAEAIALPYVTHPVRSGFSSRPREPWEAGVNLLCWTASRQIRAVEAAAVADRPWHMRWRVGLLHTTRHWREAAMARRIRALLLTQVEKRLPIRDALALADAPIWFWGDLSRVLGPKPFRDLLAAYPLQGIPERQFLQALQAEAAFVARDWNGAVTLGRQALASLPQEEALLRARITLLIAESSRRLNRDSGGMEWFANAYRTDRAAFLKLLIPLPVMAAPPELARSPLVRITPAGARISLDASGGRLAGRVDWGHGSTPDVVEGSLSAGSQPDSRAAQLHRILFSPLGLLKEADYARLEGGAVSGPEEQPDRMDRMLRNATR